MELVLLLGFIASLIVTGLILVENNRLKKANERTKYNPLTTSVNSLEFKPDPNTYYRLSTQLHGDDKSLDIIKGENNDKPVLAKSGHSNGQMWKITAIDDGFYRLNTFFQGQNRSLGLADDSTTNDGPMLVVTTNHAGQQWKITAIGNGFYRLTTKR